jgi:hypothetical protein
MNEDIRRFEALTDAESAAVKVGVGVGFLSGMGVALHQPVEDNRPAELSHLNNQLDNLRYLQKHDSADPLRVKIFLNGTVEHKQAEINNAALHGPQPNPYLQVGEVVGGMGLAAVAVTGLVCAARYLRHLRKPKIFKSDISAEELSSWYHGSDSSPES